MQNFKKESYQPSTFQNSRIEEVTEEQNLQTARGPRQVQQLALPPPAPINHMTGGQVERRLQEHPQEGQKQ